MHNNNHNKIMDGKEHQVRKELVPNYVEISKAKEVDHHVGYQLQTVKYHQMPSKAELMVSQTLV